MKSACFICLLFAIPLFAQSNAVPLVNQPLVPSSAAPGGPGFTLTLNGTGFVPSSVVNWSGSALATTYISSVQLNAAVSASDLIVPTTALITVSSPSPGGGSSALSFLQVQTPQPTVSFAGSQIATGSRPNSGSVADLNGDGFLDLVVPNENLGAASSVSVFLGNGDGSFQPKVDYAVGAGPVATVVGDFNGDGKLDLAVANARGRSVSILLGNGDGTFRQHVDYAANPQPLSIAVADLNGDGKLDLIVGTYGESAISVLLGNGDGTFESPRSFPCGAGPLALSVGDYNKDGIPDVATANFIANTVSILLGNGDGTFQARTDYPGLRGPISLATADVNADGKLDLLVANTTCRSTCTQAGSVSVLLGHGDGTLSSPVDYPVAFVPYSVSTADFNGDGNLDLAVANYSSNSVSLLLGNGDGTFQTHLDFPTGSEPFWVGIGDFNRDGSQDIAIANAGANTLSVLLQVPLTTVALSKNQLTFATQLVGTTSASQSVLVTNAGALPLIVANVVSTGDFSQTNTCNIAIPPGASCNVEVTFTPKTTNTRTGTIVITDNATPNPQIISLIGTGTVVSLSTASLNFAATKVGTTSSPMSISLTNTGTASLIFSVIGITGADAADFAQTNTCGASIAAEASCTLTITFSPTAKAKRTASLQIQDNGGSSPQRVSLVGSGT